MLSIFPNLSCHAPPLLVQEFSTQLLSLWQDYLVPFPMCLITAHPKSTVFPHRATPLLEVNNFRFLAKILVLVTLVVVELTPIYLSKWGLRIVYQFCIERTQVFYVL